MRKATLLGILLLVVSVVYAISFAFAFVSYGEWVDSVLNEYSPEIRPYVDVPAFPQTSQGSVLVGVGLVLAFSYTAFVGLTWRRKAK